MRTIEKLQVLTTGRVDANGNQIPPHVIDWTDYDKNPVLLYNPDTEGHYGVVVGKVLNRKRIGDGFAGNLSFMERVKDADIAYEKYTQGVLPFVSIGGFAVGEEKEGVFHVMKYRVREFSLVKFPANIDCKMVEASELKANEQRIVSELSVEGKEVRYLTMSADNVDLERMLNANDENMTEEERLAAEQAEQTANAEETNAEETNAEETNASEETTEENAEEEINASEETTEENAEEETNAEENAEEETNASEETTEENAEEETNASEEITEENAEEETNASEETTEEETNASEAEANGTETNASAESPLPNGMEWHERNNSQTKSIIMNKTFRELNCDADFQKRMQALSAAVRTGASKTDALPENVETMQILASAMLADDKAVILASRTHYTDGVTKERKNALEVLIDCAAGNATAATLAAADLGIIKWLSLFFQKMFANDTFRRSLRFVPMSDKAGAIYIEDGVNAPTYVGNNTPLNAPLYSYDDIKRTIARRVFAFTPILFQHSELAVLAYDKQSHGIRTTMGQSMQDFSTYILQVIANTADVTKIKTSGTRTASTAGMFPIEAPNSGVTVKMPNLDDVLSVESAFLMQQYSFAEGRNVEMVLPARVYGMLASDPECRSRLIKELNGNLASAINFSATRITPRNPVARYNTASDAAELDPAMYTDNTVNDDGTFTPVTPATTTADHVGAGVAFVENEVIAGVGAIELIVERDPKNYGTVISGWFSGGATVARQNGVGAALVIPGV